MLRFVRLIPVLCLTLGACIRHPIPYEPVANMRIGKAIDVLQRQFDESVARSTQSIRVSRYKIEFFDQKYAPMKTINVYFFDAIGRMYMVERKFRSGILIVVFNSEQDRNFQIVMRTQESARLFLDAMATLIEDAKQRGPMTRDDAGYEMAPTQRQYDPPPP